MNIEQNLNGNQLELALSGRLDTNTAAILEQEIIKLENINSLVLDLKDLQYISSAGLRVILMAHKKMRAVAGSMKIKQPNDIVMEVFEMTGFNDILIIEK